MGKRKTGPLREPEEEASEHKESKKKSRFGPVSELSYENLQDRATELENDVQQVRRGLERLKGNNTTLYGNTEAKILNNRLRKAETAYGEVQRELVRRVQEMQGNVVRQPQQLLASNAAPSAAQLLRFGLGSGAVPVASTAVLGAPAAISNPVPAAFRTPVPVHVPAPSHLVPMLSSTVQVPCLGAMDGAGGCAPQPLLRRLG
mmetsp:Transcript_44457/g.102750  ORF Transcript_44457/g.102750 Transcript_44457/m.102750 type:complete len:203 (+) Transcript_44457:121-729(+)